MLLSTQMLTEEVHAAGVAEKISAHENAAHEKRNWVRLTFDCNNRCVFCLDSETHDGEMRDRDEIKRQILDGRRAGATRLILSGGEPTIHPNYQDFIRLGARRLSKNPDGHQRSAVLVREIFGRLRLGRLVGDHVFAARPQRPHP